MAAVVRTRWVSRIGVFHFFLSIIFSLILFNRALAHQISEGDSIRIKSYSTNDGLSDETVNAILQDKDGFVWIGTEYGLNRFDGVIFKKYYYNEADTTSLSGNYILNLHEGPKGNIWIGTFEGGVCYYDRRTDTFGRIKLQETNGNQMVTCFAVDVSGAVWVGTTSVCGVKYSSLNIPSSRRPSMKDFKSTPPLLRLNR